MPRASVGRYFPQSLVIFNSLARLTQLFRSQVFDFCFASFLTMTFAIYALVSTKVFNTFLCDQYGDDPTFYLVADQRIDCESHEHKVFE